MKLSHVALKTRYHSARSKVVHVVKRPAACGAEVGNLEPVVTEYRTVRLSKTNTIEVSE
jgi:hypothetical protein